MNLGWGVLKVKWSTWDSYSQPLWLRQLKGFLFCFKWANIFIYSLIASEVFFNDILGLRFFARVLNHPQLQPTTFHGFSSQSVLQRTTHSPGFFLSSTLIRLIWCSAQCASINFTYIGSSQLDASAHRWAWRLFKALEASCVPQARPLWMRGSSATLVEQYWCPLHLQQQCLAQPRWWIIGESWTHLSLYITQRLQGKRKTIRSFKFFLLMVRPKMGLWLWKASWHPSPGT